MTLRQKIDQDFLNAYKSKEIEKKDFLGLLKGDIQNNVGKMIPDTDENILKLIKVFEKNINEMISAKRNVGQNVDKELRELEYLSVYKPQLLSNDEILQIVKEILSRENVRKEVGPLMGIFNKENKGKPFENETVQKIILEQITN